MARTKGSKNKDLQSKIDDIIKDVVKLNRDEKETAEAIAEIEDLLDPPKQEALEDKKFIGYHPISGEKVYI